MNHGFTYTGIIGTRDEGSSLLDHLATRYGHTPATEWRERIESGLVLIDDRPARADARLARGQRVAWVRPPWEEPEAPLAFAVLHEDEDLMAVAKPSGLPTQPNGGFLEHTLLHLVRCRHPKASPVHRLGRGTSGLVMFSLNTKANSALCETLRRREAIKIYRALVQGHPALDTFTVDTPIGPVPHTTLDMVHAANPEGRAARSHVQVLEHRQTDSLVEVRIETGRPHQIRIHMAACGHPLVGDPLYAPGGDIRPDTSALPGDTGYLLHAFRLGLSHPRTGAWLDLECQPPPKLRF
ncbi:MAG TPA: RluA family pseudouridine synthase [Holophagaceae bacterium]|jgi:23S rRNA pseudouridine1911/1915/1917 synthase|nr:RluA family pseudouridine synthase [Holophagaceae bacterium]